MTFKIGDKVKVLNNDHNPNHYLTIGSVAEVVKVFHSCLSLKGEGRSPGSSTQSVNFACVQKVEDMFEDGWILNDGKVTIPDDAQKSMHEGSVVAFRKRKPVVFNFGDKVMYEDGTIYIFITNTQPGWCHGIKETSQCCTTLNLNKLTKV